jgi:hypothetical protein
MIEQDSYDVTLSETDKVSSAWATVVKYAGLRIVELRAKLEGAGSWDETIAIQSRIREVRLLLELGRTQALTGEDDE